jgi:hypothetical protein
LNEVRIHETHLNALNDLILEHEIPKDDLSSIVLACRCGLFCRSFSPLMIYPSKDGQKMGDQFEVREIPKDDLSLIVLVCRCGLFCRSFLRHGRRSFCPSKDGHKMGGRFLVHEIPKDGQNEKLAYARLLNQKHGSRYRKVCLTSSFFPGGRKLDHRCEAYLTTRALERGHLILEHRRSFWFRALRGHQHCDEACDRLQFLEPLVPSCYRGLACGHSSREALMPPCGEAS